MVQLREHLSQILPERLYKHTLSVEKTAVQLSELFFDLHDNVTLSVASLLHDITKANSIKQQLHLCDELDIMLSNEDTSAPKVIHAKTGAAVADRYYGADDKVCRAIYSHTVGSPAMDTVEKLLFVADCIEPTREDEDCILLRDYCFLELPNRRTPSGREALLDELVRKTLDNTIAYLLKSGLPIHPDTLSSRNSYVKSDIRML